MDPAALENLLSSYARTQNRNQKNLDFFFTAQKELAAQNVSLVPLKGLDFLLRAYPVQSVRPMVDMDFLVRKSDLAKVRAYFEGRNFKRVLDSDLTYVSPDGLNLDIAWDVWYLPAPDGLWERSREENRKETPVRFLHPADALTFYMAFRAARHAALPPLFIQDLTAFFETLGREIDWKTWAADVRRLGFSPAFFHALNSAPGLKMPAGLLEDLRPRGLAEKTVYSFYEKHVDGRKKPLNYYAVWLSYPGLGGKMRLLSEKLLPDRLRAELQYGVKDFPGYLALLFTRPFRMLARIAGGAPLEEESMEGLPEGPASVSRRELVRLAEETLASGKSIRLKLSGNCMKPAVRSGDRVTIKPFSLGQMKRGDVGVFKISAENFHIYTQFTRAFTDTPFRDASNFLGKVTEVERNGRTIEMDARDGWTRWRDIYLAPANPYFLGRLRSLGRRFGRFFKR